MDYPTIQHKFMVHVRCMTYNHEKFITDTMNGFCMQETNFPFICTIIDDASTDGEQEVIKQYLEQHFDLDDESTVRNEETDNYVLSYARHKTNKNCYFAILFLKYNHNSIEKSKMQYISEWQDNAKYIALCEGDDYWTHPQKLQMQVDFLEKHADYSMACNKTAYYSLLRHTITRTDFNNSEDIDIKTEDVISQGGLYIATCSIVYRPKSALLSGIYPDYCKKCHVGDYPLQILLALNGKVRCFNECMSVYRTDNPNSWMGKLKEKTLSDKRIKGILSEVRMLQGFSNDIRDYKQVFEKRAKNNIIYCMPDKKRDPAGFIKFKEAFQQDIKSFNKIDLLRLRAYHYGGFPNLFYRAYIYSKRCLGFA